MATALDAFLVSLEELQIRIRAEMGLLSPGADERSAQDVYTQLGQCQVVNAIGTFECVLFFFVA